jgi:hypothetical protein
VSDAARLDHGICSGWRLLWRRFLGARSGTEEGFSERSCPIKIHQESITTSSRTQVQYRLESIVVGLANCTGSRFAARLKSQGADSYGWGQIG